MVCMSIFLGKLRGLALHPHALAAASVLACHYPVYGSLHLAYLPLQPLARM
jgi:hypothetical protein